MAIYELIEAYNDCAEAVRQIDEDSEKKLIEAFERDALNNALQCECGGDKTDGGHYDWCPKYMGNT